MDLAITHAPQPGHTEDGAGTNAGRSGGAGPDRYEIYREMLQKPFPDKVLEATMMRYRIKFLRGLLVAHFIRKANMRN